MSKKEEVQKDEDQKKEDEATKKRDDRVKPVVRRILTTMAAHADELYFGSYGVNVDGANEYYNEFVENFILPIIFDPKVDLEVQDITYVFTLLNQVTGFVKDKVDNTMQMHYDRATALLYDRKYVDEITVFDVNKVLVQKSVDKGVDKKGKKK